MVRKKTKALKKVGNRIKTIREELERDHFRVSIFGSARIKRRNPLYKQVHDLALRLAEMDIDVVTGGGPGLMQAANEGHHEGSIYNNSHSIGLGIKLPREQSFNKHLDIKKEYHLFTNRLDEFMVLSNAVVVTSGGVGTLLEFFYTWQLAQVNHIAHIPIILLGKEWPPLIKWLEKYPLENKYFKKADLGLIFLAKDTNEAIEMIKKAKAEYEKGGKDYRKYHTRYKIE